MRQSTLAESFLADFDDADDAEEAAQEQPRQPPPPPRTESVQPAQPGAASASYGNVLAVDGRGADGSDAVANSDVDVDAAALSAQPSSLSPLLTSGALPSHVASLAVLLQAAHVHESHEMAALSSSIRYVSSIDSETALVQRFLRGLYGRRFAELEQLVSSPAEYARCALILGNFADDAEGRLREREREKELQAFLPHNVVLTITVTATTSAGRRLSDDDWARVQEACTTVLRLQELRASLVTYLESRMSLIAPNTAALVGAGVAAHLISVAGGLRRLSEIPACNLQVLGTKKQRQAALSSVAQELHVGVLGQSAVLQTCPTALRRRAVRLLAGKVALAARIDEHREDVAGQRGCQLRLEVEERIERWQEPPPSSVTKALPVPLAQSNKRRRGGKRYRKEKSAAHISELHKAKNRMAFAKEELVDDYTGERFGVIGQEGGGSLKLREAEGQKLSARLSRDMQRRLGYSQGKGGAGGTVTVGGAGTQSVGGAVTVIGGGGGGTASSIAFTPVQGMELVNNEHKRLKQAECDRYFASTAVFVKVGKEPPDRRPLPAVPKF